MKNILFMMIISGCLIGFACKKESQSERFKLLTGPVWYADSLLSNGVDASGTGGVLQKFKGDAKFKEDGTGYFGKYTGTWQFNPYETKVTIASDSLIFPVVCDIIELNSSSFKVKTVVPNPLNITQYLNIRMTFKPK
jgi:hypothetical protein